MTPTPQQIKAALDDTDIRIRNLSGVKLPNHWIESRLEILHTLQALLQQASDEGMVRVPKAYVDAVSELVEVAELRGDCDLPHPADDPRIWTARMQDAWIEIFTQSRALTAADAGEVKP